RPVKHTAKLTRPAKLSTNGDHRKVSAHGPGVNGTSKNGTTKSAAKTTASLPPTKPGAAPAKGDAKAAPTPAASKDTPLPRTTGPQAKDRIYLAVNDPYWLHVMWDIAATSVQRAEAALKQDWYGAKRIIRLSDVTSHDTTSTSETPIRDIPIDVD